MGVKSIKRGSARKMIMAIVMGFSSAMPGVAQRPDLTFDHYNVEDGLSQSTVWSIFEDSKGFIWFCTPDGLNKFDGYSFTVYRHIRGDTNSISNNHTKFILEDSDGDLWIGHRGGLSKYHYHHDRFSQVYQLPQVNTEEEGLLPLHESDGRIWAWDRNQGMIGFNKRTLEQEVVHAVPAKYFQNILAYSRFGKTIDRKAFISTTNNLMIVFDFHTLEYTFLFNKVLDPGYAGISNANKFAVDKHDNLWISGQDGLAYLNTKTLSTEFYKNRFNGEYLTSCTFDTDGRLWIGSSTSGLYIMDIQTKAITNISRENYKENGLLYNYIESLFTDSSGNIWIGTNGFGIHKFSKHKNKFDHFDLKIGTNSFGGNLVKSIAEDAGGNLYVGTYGNGLYVISKNGEVKNFSVPQNNTATGLTVTSDGDVLVSNDVGLHQLRNNRIVPLNVQAKVMPGHITSLVRTSSHEILVTSDRGVFSLAKKGNQYQLKARWPLAGLTLTSVAYKDSRERTWIGTQRSFYVITKTDTMPRLMEQVTKNHVKSFSEDESGNVWIATIGELICFNPETGKVDLLDEKDGFANTFFYAAMPGNDHKLWASSNEGLACYDPKLKTVKNYTVLDGLQSNEFNTGAFLKLNDGRLAFGGLNGVNLFDPTAIRENPNLPKIVFTNFSVDDKSRKLDTSIVYKKRIELNYSDNTFSFQFSGLEYTSPENNRYAYMLKGHDKDWVQGGDRRFVRYSRLSPGQYEFLVKASNSDGVWNETPATVTVDILPPFYMQAWFLLSAILSSVVIVVLISVQIVRGRYRSRLRQLEVNHKVQLERERISRDLHDHVGSQLTFIINQLNGGGQEVMKRDQLTDARDAAKMTMGNLRETIWALQREAITLVDFTDRVKEFAMKQIKSKRGMQLDFEENLDAGHLLNPSKALNLFRIAQEAINNAVKHSNGSMLSISMEQVEGLVKLKIADNGRGFPIDATASNGYGLQNIAFRAKEIDAVLSIKALPERGTTVTVSLALMPNP